MSVKFVQFYDTRVQRDFYEKRGWRGRFVLLLAGVAAWLARKCEYLTMRLIMSDRPDRFPKEVQAAVIERFHHEDGKQTRKRATLRAFFRNEVALELPVTPATQLEQRYSEGRKSADDAATKAHASSQALYKMSLVGREGRYKLDQNQRNVMELDVQPVPATVTTVEVQRTTNA